jgi:hypothetical protein
MDQKISPERANGDYPTSIFAVKIARKAGQ